MIEKSVIGIMAFAIFIFLASDSMAIDGGQYLPDGGSYFPDGGQYFPDEGQYFPDVGPYLPDNGSASQDEHPVTGPIGSPPSSEPDSSTEALSYTDGQELTQQDMQNIGGAMLAYALKPGLRLWVRCDGRWTLRPTAACYLESTSTLTYNDQPQYIWSWEMYPKGRQVWKQWGYKNAGFIHCRFTGAMRGWHQLAMWGSKSGWSNSVWISVG